MQKSPNPAMQSNKPRLEQGREGPLREMSVPTQAQSQVQSKEVVQTRGQILSKHREVMQTPLTKQTTLRHIEQKLETGIMPEHTNRPQVTEMQILSYPNPSMKPPPRLPDLKMQDVRKKNLDLDLEINKDFEENSPYQEGIISEIYQRPDRSQLLEPPGLADLINTNNIVQKYLPKQTVIDQILKNYTKKSVEGNSSPYNNKIDTSGTFK